MFTLLGFFGFINLYAMRVNLSVAIVAMVKSKPSGSNGTNFEVNNTCPTPIKVNSSSDNNFYIQVVVLCTSISIQQAEGDYS